MDFAFGFGFGKRSSTADRLLQQRAHACTLAEAEQGKQTFDSPWLPCQDIGSAAAPSQGERARRVGSMNVASRGTVGCNLPIPPKHAIP